MVTNNEYSYTEEKYTNLMWQNMLRIQLKLYYIIKYNDVTLGTFYWSGCLKENDQLKECDF